ncbi:MAG: polymerase primary sigma factor [Microbacteriaceae bacterium]|jgi:hypothetical protein|nr:polymerase primary sigma factor [Microbacteriaceae bacterium]
MLAGADGYDAPGGPSAQDLIWDEEESKALRQARKDANLTASAGPVRAYLKQIGKIARLPAEEEVQVAKRIEAGLHAAERLRCAKDVADKLSLQLHRDLNWIVHDGERAKSTSWKATCASSSRWPSATPAQACHSWTGSRKATGS